jgi:hypothetical protein
MVFIQELAGVDLLISSPCGKNPATRITFTDYYSLYTAHWLLVTEY